MTSPAVIARRISPLEPAPLSAQFCFHLQALPQLLPPNLHQQLRNRIFLMSDVHPNTLRVIAAARDAGLEITTRRFPEGTKTAADAAAAIGVTVGQIVKSLVFGVDDEIVMALVSGSNQLDEKKLALAAGGAKCARVDADAVREATGYPIGGVPPFGHATQLRMFVDPDLLQYDEVWAAAGTWNDNFGANPNDIVRVAGGVVTDLKRG